MIQSAFKTHVMATAWEAHRHRGRRVVILLILPLSEAMSLFAAEFLRSDVAIFSKASSAGGSETVGKLGQGYMVNFDAPVLNLKIDVVS